MAQSLLHLSRSDNLNLLSDRSPLDLLIIGGGIHGASAARLAAHQGWRVALLEKNDFASATSSRSSKMVHGGLRYLEMFDFKQVFEGIRARDNLFQSAPHLVKPYPFLIPIARGSHFERLRMKLGLTLYDLLLKERSFKHRWIKSEDLESDLFPGGSSSLAGCFQYTDGIMDDTRLVIENLIDARINGAITLNYCEALAKRNTRGGQVEIDFRDTLGDCQQTVTARMVLNCAGPWAPLLFSDQENAKVCYSSGAHLLFPYRWKEPALFLPLPGKARYYFVWPHPSGTMVGTTERQITRLDDDPQPDSSELREIFGRIKKDLAHINLGSSHYAFAGVRILPLRDPSKETGRLSRKHLWETEPGMLTLLGGKYTTALWTAEEGLKKAAKALGLNYSRFSHATPLPGGRSQGKSIEVMVHLSRDRSIPESTTERLINRFGSRIDPDNFDFSPVTPDLTQGELNLVIQQEQTECLEDLMRRRLDLEYMSGNGIKELDTIGARLQKLKPGIDISAQKQRYQERISKVLELISTAKR